MMFPAALRLWRQVVRPFAFPTTAIAIGVSVFLGGCQAPVDLNVQLWVPTNDGVVSNAAGFDLSVVVAGNAGTPERLTRGEDGLAKDIEGLSVPEGGLDVDMVLLEAIDGNATSIASGRTGPTTLLPDGTSMPASLTAILVPEGISNITETLPRGRNDAAVCAGGDGRAYVIGGINNTGGLIDEHVRVDPSVRDAVEISGPSRQRDGSCAARADADSEDLWLVGGCIDIDTPLGLSRSQDFGESFSVVDPAALECLTAASIFGDRLWILAGDLVQVRDAQNGVLIGEASLTPARFGGTIVATADGAVVGGGYLTASAGTFTSIQLEYVTESGGALSLAPFGPENVEEASFATDSDGQVFALLTTTATVQIHRLQPAIASAPVQVEVTPLTAGAFDPQHLITAPANSFLVLNESESQVREVNNDGTTTDFSANAFGASMLNDAAGAVYILGGRADGVKAYVQQIQ